jgi:minor histocompatibility antigen H13
MADSIAEEVLVNETNETLSNMSNTTGRQAASTEGLVTAYLLMFLMALFPIFVGSIRSVTYHYNLKKKGEEAEERIRMRDAAIFPIYASGCLFGLYLVFKYLPKDFVNLLLNILFFSVGVTALTRFGSVAVDYISSSSNKLTKYILHFQKKKPDQIKDIFKVDFTAIDVVLFILSVFLVSWNIITKDWIINNLMGIAFCFNAIELISLESFSVGCTLLGGLFLYDIFWVFGTDVMVTVAKSFDAPIKCK